MIYLADIAKRCGHMWSVTMRAHVTSTTRVDSSLLADFKDPSKIDANPHNELLDPFRSHSTPDSVSPFSHGNADALSKPGTNGQQPSSKKHILLPIRLSGTPQIHYLNHKPRVRLRSYTHVDTSRLYCLVR